MVASKDIFADCAVEDEKGESATCDLKLQLYDAIYVHMSIARAHDVILSGYYTILSDYDAIFSGYNAILNGYYALLNGYYAILSEYDEI